MTIFTGFEPRIELKFGTGTSILHSLPAKDQRARILLYLSRLIHPHLGELFKWGFVAKTMVVILIHFDCAWRWIIPDQILGSI